jgi:hypothetical protein
MDNEQDVKDLFDIFPSYAASISCEDGNCCLRNYVGAPIVNISYIGIDCCGKTEVRRPVDYSQYIGKYGLFSCQPDQSIKEFGILDEKTIYPDYPYVGRVGNTYSNYRYFRPLTDEEKANLA